MKTNYDLTPKGLLGDEAYKDLIFHLVTRKLNAVILADGKLIFSEVELVEDKKRKGKK